MAGTAWIPTVPGRPLDDAVGSSGDRSAARTTVDPSTTTTGEDDDESDACRRGRGPRDLLAGARWLWSRRPGRRLRPDNALGLGFLGVSFAFGLTVLTGAYALGHISGGHFNPAVTIGLWTAKKFPARDILPYVAAQVVGAILASLTLWGILEGRPGFETTGNWLAANGFGDSSPGRLRHRLGPHRRGRADRHLPGRDPRHHRSAGPGRLRPDGHRPLPDPDPPDQHPGDQHLGEPGPLDRPGPASSAARTSSSSGSSGWPPSPARVIGAVVHRFVSGDEDTDEVEIS